MNQVVTFKWISEDYTKCAFISVEVNLSETDDEVQFRQRAYDILAEIIGEENIRRCAIHKWVAKLI